MSVNTMLISPKDALDTLKALWDARVKSSVMMHGSPGIGKSQIAEQLAAYIGGPLYDVRLTTIEQQDLRGLPYYNHETKKTVWYRPEDMPDIGPAVLFLDELSSAPPALQPTVYGLLQERRVGKHKLPDDVFVLAAGNTVEDGAVAYELGTAIADRLIHLQVASNPDEWTRNWAPNNGIHPAVIAYIRTRPDHFETTKAALAQNQMISATPRSWERVSDVMRGVADRRIQQVLISGIVGDAIAAQFQIVADDIHANVRIDDMLRTPRGEKRTALYPASIHGLNALTFGLVGIINKDNIEPVFEILLDMRRLAKLRPADGFDRMPVQELSVNGFEMVFEKVTKDRAMTDIAVASPVYAEYDAEWKALGLS